VIVVDTNVISYLLIPGAFTEAAEKAARRDQWCAPLLWRSEFRNVLALMARRKRLSLAQAREIMALAERLFWGREFMVRSSTVFDCVSASNRSAYDCEFVGLAVDLGMRLVTTDEPVVDEFPNAAIHLRDYVGG
jgi:predicted nucleic acid-binding protein